MPSTIESLVDGFPYPIVTPIVGEPNYESIAALHLQLNANAASIQSHLGNGQLGLLSLTVSPAVYATLSAVPFVPPANPGASPDIPDGSTGPQIANFRLTFVEETKLFKEYDLADKALKQLLLGAVDDMFVRSLQTKYIGYLNVTTRALLDHLYAQYARISAADLHANDGNFKAAYDPNLPIETLFDQIENGVDFAAAALTPYTPEQVVSTAYQCIFATGLFTEECKVWKRRTSADKTWANFKTAFSLAHRELREARLTTAGATGYSSANSVVQSAGHVHQQETIDAIANLATATSHDRASVATLTATNSTLTAELTKVNAKLVNALQDNLKLAEKLAAKSPTPGGERQEARHYCWSCGYRCTHASFKCTVPKPGHQKGAKAADIMGGSTVNKE